MSERWLRPGKPGHTRLPNSCKPLRLRQGEKLRRGLGQLANSQGWEALAFLLTVPTFSEHLDLSIWLPQRGSDQEAPRSSSGPRSTRLQSPASSLPQELGARQGTQSSSWVGCWTVFFLRHAG